MQLQTLLFGTNGRAAGRPAALFTLLNLGLIESLANGMLSPDEAVRMFYNAENCLFVAKRLCQKIAGEIISRGTATSDLFEALPADKADAGVST